jgi:hypothetical protein
MPSLIRKQGNLNYKFNQKLCETPPMFVIQEKENVAGIKLRLVYWSCIYESS